MPADNTTARVAPSAAPGGGELEKLFKEVGGEADPVAAILKALQINLKFGPDVSVKKFYRYMVRLPGGVGKFFAQMGEADSDWVDNGPIMFILDQAFEAAKELEEKEEKLTKVTDEDEAAPISPELNKSLTELWKEKYGFDLHPSQECSGRKLHAMWKKLKMRKGSAEQIKGLWTKESDVHRENVPKRQKEALGKNFSIVNNDKTVDPDQPHFNAWATPLHFLTALDAHLRTLAKAGCFYIEDPSSKETVLMIDRQVIEHHLAECRCFVMEWTTKKQRPDDMTIIRQLHRIDMLIRARWWTLLAENDPPGKSFTQCVRETRVYSDQLWAQDFGKLLLDWTPRTPSKRGRSGGRDSSPEKKTRRRHSPRRSPRRSPRGGRRDRPGGRQPSRDKKPDREPAKEKTLKTRTAGPADKRILIALENKKGTFCAGYNGHKECTKTDCRDLHKCNVMVSETEVCMGAHSAQSHTGKVVKMN